MKDLMFKVMNGAHRVLLKVTGGRFGNEFMDMPVLELTTTGRRSGERRTTMLTAPVVDGDTMVIVASRGGDDRHPAWFLNLRADPDVEVAAPGRPPRPMRARILEGDERTAMWARVVADHDNYAGYQRRTEREIPLVALEPRG